jgi:hypothetical protein
MVSDCNFLVFISRTLINVPHGMYGMYYVCSAPSCMFYTVCMFRMGCMFRIA